MSENKNYEQLKALERELDRKELKIRELLDTITALEGGDERNYRREFTANVSHELKTPLTSISGFAELIRDGFAAGEDARRFAGKIYDEAQRMITLIGDIMKLSQLDENSVPEDMAEVDLYECARESLDRLGEEACSKGVTLSLEGGSSIVMGAGQIVDEMMFNLCQNAVKYNVPGGSVTVRVFPRGFSVSDTGIGIPKEHHERVFERFYRVDKSHSKEIGGTGLGLSIVKHAAAYHGATVRLESEVGKGTEIRVLFP